MWFQRGVGSPCPFSPSYPAVLCLAANPQSSFPPSRGCPQGGHVVKWFSAGTQDPEGQNHGCEPNAGMASQHGHRH